MYRPGGEIGRHAILRGWCRKASRFESAPGHKTSRNSEPKSDRQKRTTWFRADSWQHTAGSFAVGGWQLVTCSWQLQSRHSSSAVEHSIRNRAVVGSIPTCGSARTVQIRLQSPYRRGQVLEARVTPSLAAVSLLRLRPGRTRGLPQFRSAGILSLRPPHDARAHSARALTPAQPGSSRSNRPADAFTPAVLR